MRGQRLRNDAAARGLEATGGRAGECGAYFKTRATSGLTTRWLEGTSGSLAA